MNQRSQNKCFEHILLKNDNFHQLEDLWFRRIQLEIKWLMTVKCPHNWTNSSKPEPNKNKLNKKHIKRNIISFEMWMQSYLNVSIE